MAKNSKKKRKTDSRRRRTVNSVVEPGSALYDWWWNWAAANQPEVIAGHPPGGTFHVQIYYPKRSAQARRREVEMERSLRNAAMFHHSLGQYALQHPGAPVPERQAALLLPPGAQMRGWLGLLFWSPSARTRFLEPILADLQHEWLEAHKKGDMRLARRVQVLGMISLFWALLARLPFSVIRVLWEAWKRTKVG